MKSSQWGQSTETLRFLEHLLLASLALRSLPVVPADPRPTINLINLFVKRQGEKLLKIPAR